MGRGKLTEAGTALRLTVGNNVKIARERAGLSQRELCRITGISQPYLSQVENGTWNMALDNIANISAALGLAAHELLDPHFSSRPVGESPST